MSSDLRTFAIDACPSCGSHAWTSFPFGESSLRKCDSCRLVFAAVCAEPSDIYVDGYLFGTTDFGPNCMHPLFQEYLALTGHIRMGLIERATGIKGSVLDVGCGTGEVLAAARDRGWKTTGVEPVAESARHATEQHGLDIKQTMLEESGLPERSFDVVTAFHVVEHLTDSTGFLKLISRWAKPSGYVAVEVPNWRSFHRRNAGGAWIGLRPLEHVAHYGPAQLKSTMVRAGLEPVMVTTPGFLCKQQTLDQQLSDLGLYRLMGRLNPLGHPGLQDGKSRVMPRRGTAAALAGLQSIYKQLGVGQVVLGVARVP